MVACAAEGCSHDQVFDLMTNYCVGRIGKKSAIVATYSEGWGL